MASNKVSSNELHHPHSAQIAQHHQMQHDDQINHQHHHQNQYNNSMFSFGMMPSSSSATPINISKESDAYESGYSDQAFCQYGCLNGQDPSSSQDQRQMSQHTLSIIPSQALHGEPIFTGISSGLQTPFEASNPRNDVQESASVVQFQRGVNYQGSTLEQDVQKSTDLKTLSRLAQNREAARKSRLKKKAYVQHLESKKIELDQLKLKIQNARAQGILLGGNENEGEQDLPYTNIIPGAAQFDMEYAQWLEVHHCLTVELKGAVNAYRPESELGNAIANWLAHCDQIVGLKSKALKDGVFHIFSGMWKAPAERCFMWMGGFRPSVVIKIALDEMEGLTEQQWVALCGLQRSTDEAEEAITDWFETLDRSLTKTIVSGTLTMPPDLNKYMTQMSIATKQVSALQGVVTQGDSLRLQTLRQLPQHLTNRQAAQCFLVIGEYFNRVRSLSTLWLNRTRHD